MAEMKAKHVEIIENKAKGHGQYTEIKEEEFLQNVTASKFCVVHFYHADFERCKIVDMHLKKIAHDHTEAKFMTMNAEKAPFFVQKLQVQMLPEIVCFMDGVVLDRVCGFEELGGKDEFPTILLARRLVQTGVIKAKNRIEKGQMKISKKVRDDISDDEDN